MCDFCGLDLFSPALEVESGLLCGRLLFESSKSKELSALKCPGRQKTVVPPLLSPPLAS
jgi:hypothetical protein